MLLVGMRPDFDARLKMALEVRGVRDTGLFFAGPDVETAVEEFSAKGAQAETQINSVKPSHSTRLSFPTMSVCAGFWRRKAT